MSIGRVARGLSKLGAVLRRALPPASGRRLALHVDGLYALDATAFYLRGWVWDEHAPAAGLTARPPRGRRLDLWDRAVRCPRPDVRQARGAADAATVPAPGLLAFAELPPPGPPPEMWTFEVRDLAHNAVRMRARPVVANSDAARAALLADLTALGPVGEEVLVQHFFSALARLQAQQPATAEVRDVHQYGPTPHAPAVSLVVPLYGRLDFVEHQLAQFALDPEVAAADLVYVLDSPERHGDLRRAALQLYRLYRVPFRVATLRHNAGYARASNTGAALARGRLLLLLNSDVLPDRPGWLGKLVAFHDAIPGVGAVGPKLLYEDDALQHAGLYFHRPEGADLWENRHYFKGLSRHLPAAGVCRPVPAVTGACLLIDRGLFQGVGGLPSHYLHGDYEDSELCLRLLEVGRQNWYLPGVELYHLEGQSYPGPLRTSVNLFNRWLHTRRWGERIEAVMAGFADGPVGADRCAA